MKTNTISQNTAASWIKGYWFYFEIDEHQISVHCSIWTGRRRIWIDDDEIVNIIPWRLKTNHEITINGQRYRLKIAYKKLLTCLSCTASLEEKQVAYAETALLTKKQFWIGVLAFFLGGAVSGFITGAIWFGL